MSWEKGGSALNSPNGRENVMVRGWLALLADITEGNVPCSPLTLNSKIKNCKVRVGKLPKRGGVEREERKLHHFIDVEP